MMVDIQPPPHQTGGNGVVMPDLRTFAGAVPVPRLLLAAMIVTLLAGGLSACGKRGDPYRPSELPSAEDADNPA